MSVLPVGISGEAGEYQVERSLRFNSADSAYLNRTPASAGNRRTFTYSGWLKRGLISGRRSIFSAGTTNTGGQPGGGFYINNSTDKLEVVHGGATSAYLVTTQVFRDPSAWFHLVVAYDTTQASSSDRIKIYINGVQVTSFDTATYPSQNYEFDFNNTIVHAIGSRTDDGTIPNTLWDGYMAEVHFIDGSALDPTSFGEFDTDTGVWKPKAYSGSYGTNGFYLDFADNSSTTALGYDAAGSNDWTPNNFSVTAGAGNDSLVDSPTRYGTDTGAGGEVRGNYCTMSPIDKTSGATLSEGNLKVTTSGANTNIRATFNIPSSGKWYFEAFDAVSGGNNLVGLVNTTVPISSSQTGATGSIYTGMSGNDYFRFAINKDANTYTIYQDASVLASGSLTAGMEYSIFIATSASGGASTEFNFGQRPFAYTAPSGFKALCTTNLPEPTIADGGEYFNAVLWTGNGSTQSITGVGFQPDFVWVKDRSNARDHRLIDAVRGTTHSLISNTTDAEDTDTNKITSFDSDGFGVGISAAVNGSGETYVAWNWKANGAGVSNTAGTISSTVSANTTSGFSVVTWAGTNSSETIGHGLGVAPAMIIIKNRDVGTDNWVVYHSGLSAPTDEFLRLNLTNAKLTVSGYWVSGSASTTFGVGNYSAVNALGSDYVAYCFAPIAGYSAFGSYTGNGSTDGPFVYTGFRPKFLIVKRTDTTANWYLYDSVRTPENQTNFAYLNPNTSGVEDYYQQYDFLSNGFKNRTDLVYFNASGGTYIYAAFAENPFKYSLGR
jgi:hypothetical protein